LNSGAPLFPPPPEVGDLRKRRLGDPELRSFLGRAAVEAAGEVGYEELTVHRVLERAGVSRAVFYRLFEDRDHCYLRGYSELIDVLGSRLLDHCRDSASWREALTTALRQVGELMATEPDLADGLIAQVRVAGGEAMKAHDRVAASLIGALDRGREAAPEVAPPPSAAGFIFGAIETAAVQATVRREPEDFTARVPDLTYLATAIFLGAEPGGA
jgi:AcrR family transcriptional regulator